VTIPANIKSIGEYAFLCCYGLTSVICYSSEPPTIERNVFAGLTLRNITLYCNRSFREKEVWKDFNIVEAYANDKAMLTALTVTDYETHASCPLSPAFNDTVYNYTVEVPYSVSRITIQAIPDNAKATVGSAASRIHTLNVGENPFHIRVQSGDKKTERDYWVTVIRAFATGIPQAVEPAIQVSLSGQILHVNSPAAERVNIYSVSGALLDGLEKPAGKTSVAVNSTNPLTQVLIVKGSSGWVKKLLTGN
ncbi:MAG: cadherin-like beta sandwich domain-containing protein, partial [Dysgonamonadaceae bacterium]|nr:cadherin-like beta sandwich domain-containing protein [Dysgonamonadaceae bacterium]